MAFGKTNIVCGNNIKSIQDGNVSISSTYAYADISEVDTQKSIILIQNLKRGAKTSYTHPNYYAPAVYSEAGVFFVNSTRIQFRRGTSVGSASYNWTVIEYMDATVQSGEHNSATDWFEDITVNQYDISKSILLCSLCVSNSSHTRSVVLEHVKKDSNTISIKSSSGAIPTVYWQLVSF